MSTIEAVIQEIRDRLAIRHTHPLTEEEKEAMRLRLVDLEALILLFIQETRAAIDE